MELAISALCNLHYYLLWTFELESSYTRITLFSLLIIAGI